MPNEQYSGKTMYASDIYAIGMIAMQALTGLAPNQIPEDPITSEFCWRDRAEVTPTLADVIDKMVRFDFRQRYQSANEVLAALQPLLTRSLANTIVSEITPSLAKLSPNKLSPNIGISQDEIKSPIETLIDEFSDDLEMSEDPVRAKKLICLVCTGILENDLTRLNNFSFVELIHDLYQQYPTIEALKENLVKSVKTIGIQKQRQYLIVAKIIFNAASKLYQQSAIAEPVVPSQFNPSSQSVHQPVSYSVSHLVINAGSAQLIAPFDTDTSDELSLLDSYPNDDSDIYEWVAHDIDTDAQQMRLKKLLLYTYQDVWESNLRQLNSVNWVSLLKELVSFMPTFAQLEALLQEAIQRVSKPAEYLAIGNLLLTKLAPLYPDLAYSHNVEAIAPPIAPILNQPNPYLDIPNKSKIPFDHQIASNLFDLRLELMRFTSSMRAKILLFSVLYYPFDPDRDNWQDLRTHSLDGLLRQLFYAYFTFDKAENAIWKTARSLSEPNAYDQSASYILQVVKTLYDQLQSQSMQHPAEGNLSRSDDGDFTQLSGIFHGSDDDDTCQFI